MTAFVLLAALIAAAALAFVLRPALRRRSPEHTRTELNLSVYRDQLRELDADLAAGTLARPDYDRARRELERRLLEDVGDERPGRKPRPTLGAPALKRMGIAAAVAMPLLAAGVYFAIGNPEALDPARREQPQISMKEIEAMVQRLAERLEKNPDDVDGWKMLGKSYNVMGRFAEAANAYSKAAMRAPRDPQLLADLADALAMARGQKMAGEPDELVQRALQLDPNNLKALALAGTAAFERADYRGAARFWERMLPLVPEDSEDRRTIQANIDEARAQAKLPAEKKKAVAGKGLQGTVRLAPALAAKVKPDDTLFVFARAADGPPMPIAAVRKRAADLPLTFTLDDSMAMSPQRKLSDAPRVVVVARISRSGNAVAQPGDLQGASAAVSSSARGVAVVIDSEVPKKP